MERPDLTTLACENFECQQFRQAGQGNLVIRKVYGRDGIRLLRCRTCGEEFSERRGSALCNTKLPETLALAYGQVKKCYQGNRVERVEVNVVHGKARLAHVLYLLGYKQMNTSAVERHNGTSRLRNQRKERKTFAFSKAKRYHRWMSWLSVRLYNFCRPHSSLKIRHEMQVTHRSPAMVAGLADHIYAAKMWVVCLSHDTL